MANDEERQKTSTLSRLYFSAFLSVAQAVITVQSEPRIIKDRLSELSKGSKGLAKGV